MDDLVRALNTTDDYLKLTEHGQRYHYVHTLLCAAGAAPSPQLVDEVLARTLQPRPTPPRRR